MNESDWASSGLQLTDAANRFEVLSRCLAVTAQITEWQQTRDEWSGADAANALDQALGDLKRLASGEAAALVQVVQRVLHDLPPPWE
ncbi:hypothetical protein H4P1_00081 (plasmid) [Variovorax sp. PBS-H4]|uniref:hypothetical protein n=1 Tax=Variovorax sp. PBS-H4 TaxID=434008 RepID=UPI00131997CA|nr:hypothetical protein [Variovorax sp. PBS-H4]VTU41468.1 hypothetical protein H4P1_00081 [Variovorax sp. PBS-H4]